MFLRRIRTGMLGYIGAPHWFASVGALLLPSRRLLRCIAVVATADTMLAGQRISSMSYWIFLATPCGLEAWRVGSSFGSVL